MSSGFKKLLNDNSKCVDECLFGLTSAHPHLAFHPRHRVVIDAVSYDFHGFSHFLGVCYETIYIFRMSLLIEKLVLCLVEAQATNLSLLVSYLHIDCPQLQDQHGYFLFLS